MSQRLFLSCAAGLVICLSITSASQAQWRPASQPLQKPFRFLGAGWGTGYHWRTPGHDPSYYNPYSAHNSNLISKGGYWGAGGTYTPDFGKNQSQQNFQNVVPNYPTVEAEFQPVRRKENDDDAPRTKENLKSALEPNQETEAEELDDRVQRPGNNLPKEWPFELERD